MSPRQAAAKALPVLAAAALLAAAPAAGASTSKSPSKRAHLALLIRNAPAHERAHIALLIRNAPAPKRAHIALLIRNTPAHRGCAGANTRATAAPKAAMRSAVVCLINQQRAEHHLPALHSNSRLDDSAQHWTDAMVSSDQFTHGVNFAARISAAGFHWSFAGENIASGFVSPRDVVRAWMRSPDHCQNILSPIYSDVGTGVSPHGVLGIPASTWTQDFGLWMGHSAPSNNFGPAHGCPYQGP
jgi:uncharacterized protein YkwD